jgi:aminomethyltransferase
MRQTPLFSTHVSLGGRIVPFAGWEMPVQYAGILDEARAVRTRAGLFDVSHMGRVDIRGPGAGSFLGRVLSVDVQALRTGSARYNLICNLEGGIIDDCIVYRLGEERFMVVPNASNTDEVLEWFSQWGSGLSFEMENITEGTAMIAHQGPEAAMMLSGLTERDLDRMRIFRAVETQVAGADTLLARTGYTGEDGFELIVPAESAPSVWEALSARGARPCGLGSRDVLRLEAGLLLHGNDMSTSVNPYEAGLDRFVDPDREGYVPGEALRQIRDGGPGRQLVGFKLIGRGVPRHGYAIKEGSEVIGEVSSGTFSPTLDMSIGMGYVPGRYGVVGSRFQIDMRGRAVEAEVVELPFYVSEGALLMPITTVESKKE